MKSKNKKISASLEIGILAIILLVMLIIILSPVKISKTTMSGESMEPTYCNGDNIWTFTATDFIKNRIERFDVIIFKPYGNEEYFIKRIVGMPRETILIEDGKIYINEKELDYSQLKAPIEYAGIAETPLQIGENEYFVIGDNANVSLDSRDEEIGLVSSEQITHVGMK